MAAAGKVCTGFSKPYIAKYTVSGGVVSYTDGQILARGVEVEISVDSADNNVFYADNQSAEAVSGTFTSGELTLTVDGLLASAEELLMGLPSPTVETVTTGVTANVWSYDDNIDTPYVGFGCIVRYMSDGTTYYTPMMLTKTKFNTPSINAATQEDEIDWQTQELSATIMRDDTSDHCWKKIGQDQTTEAAAEQIVKYFLGL